MDVSRDWLNVHRLPDGVRVCNIAIQKNLDRRLVVQTGMTVTIVKTRVHRDFRICRARQARAPPVVRPALCIASDSGVWPGLR